jgi:hypothetical protein
MITPPGQLLITLIKLVSFNPTTKSSNRQKAQIASKNTLGSADVYTIDINYK